MRGGVGLMLRRLVGRKAPCIASRSSSATASYSTGVILTGDRTRPLLLSSIAPVGVSINYSRNFSSSSSEEVSFPGPYPYGPGPASPSYADGSKVLLIESKWQLKECLRKVDRTLLRKWQLKSGYYVAEPLPEPLPAVFYFTAVWCGPCRLLSSVVSQLAEQYPHVTIFKVDIDLEGLGNALHKLNIHSLPTLHFYQDGKKASEVVGADVQRLKDTMESLYK